MRASFMKGGDTVTRPCSQVFFCDARTVKMTLYCLSDSTSLDYIKRQYISGLGFHEITIIKGLCMMLASRLELQRTFDKVEKKEYYKHKDEVNCFAFSPDLEIMVTGADDGKVRVFNRPTGKLVCRLIAHTGAVKSVAISQDSKLIASASYDTTVIVWRTCDTEIVYQLKGHVRSVETVTFSPDSRYVCSGAWDNSAILWDLETGTARNIFTGHRNVIQCCAFSQNSIYLATGSWDHTVRVWPLVRDGGMAQCHVLLGHTGNIHSVVFSKLGMLASGSWDKTIRFWNPKDGRHLTTLTDHNGWVQALAFSPDGCMLASVSDDDIVKVWDVKTGECAKTLQGEVDALQACVFSTEGALIVSGASTLCYANKKKKMDNEEEDENGNTEQLQAKESEGL